MYGMTMVQIETIVTKLVWELAAKADKVHFPFTYDSHTGEGDSHTGEVDVGGEDGHSVEIDVLMDQQDVQDVLDAVIPRMM